MICFFAAQKQGDTPCCMSNDPFSIFETWYAEAREAELNDSNAMTIATVDADGQPSARMVLLKGHGPEGFVFYTNQESRKAIDIGANPKAAILFHWKSLRRQIRIEGTIARVPDETADAYFATRGRDSQLGAWASMQSRPLEDRATFKARYEEVKTRFDGKNVARPPYWSGYCLAARYFEFWQDGEHRLHRRSIYTADADRWIEGLLYP